MSGTCRKLAAALSAGFILSLAGSAIPCTSAEPPHPETLLTSPDGKLRLQFQVDAPAFPDSSQ